MHARTHSPLTFQMATFDKITTDPSLTLITFVQLHSYAILGDSAPLLSTIFPRKKLKYYSGKNQGTNGSIWFYRSVYFIEKFSGDNPNFLWGIVQRHHHDHKMSDSTWLPKCSLYLVINVSSSKLIHFTSQFSGKLVWLRR